MNKTVLTGVFCALFPSISSAGLVGDTVNFNGSLGTQSAVVGADTEFTQDFTSWYQGGSVGDSIDLFDGGFTLSIWNNSSTDLDWKVDYGDIWAISDINLIGDSTATISAVNQTSGMSEHLFDIGFGYNNIRIAPKSSGLLIQQGQYKSFDFEFTFNATSVPEPSSAILLGAGLLGLGAARRKKLVHPTRYYKLDYI